MTESSDSPSQALTPVPVSSPSSAEPRAASHAATEQQVFTPPIDIFETADGLVLLADLPGVSSESLELQVQDNKLTLFGRVVPAIPEGARLLHSEYRVGHFLRSFILSDDVDHERISARLNHGVLEVVLPRAPRPEPRRIRVSTDSPPPKAP